MSAQWLLDVAALAKASRAVARSHFGFRSQQVSVFTQTTSLAAALKDRRKDSLDQELGHKPALSKNSNEGTSREALTTEAIQHPSKRGNEPRQPDSNEGQEPTEKRLCISDDSSRPNHAFQSDVLQGHQEKGHRLWSSNYTFAEQKGDTDSRGQVLSYANVNQDQHASRASTPYQIVEDTRTEEKKSPGKQSPSLRQRKQEVQVPTKGNDETIFKKPLKYLLSDGINQDRGFNNQDEDSIESRLSKETMADLFHNPKIGRALLGEGEATNPYASAAIVKDIGGWRSDDRFSATELRNITPKKSNSLDINDQRTGAGNSQSKPLQALPFLVTKEIDERPNLRESRVPSSRLGRMWQYAGLGASMSMGAVAESFRRATGQQNEIQGSLMLSSANMERLVTKLSRMRGAALKVGQLLSFQDSKILSPPINQVLQRVQDSADYMPVWQRNQVLEQNLGTGWRELFSSFDERPLAAASIGQVHAAKLSSGGQPVVVKIQYPGVAGSIDSDLNNLSILLTASRLLPKGLYLERTIANARTELAWECDYVREAEAAKAFRALLENEAEVFRVPQTFDEASGKQVLTMERMGGTAVTQIHNLPQIWRDWIGANILRLCLREITEFKYMQTDPNWTNFLFNPATERIELLDFGASRHYPDEFINPYIRLLSAASRDDRDACHELSIQLGYLTGMESKTMLDAHIKSVTILAEPFKKSAPDLYDFETQTVTDRVRDLIPVMLRERLSPPPEETYSLHRKLSGAFLMLTRLRSKVNTKDMFRMAMEKAGVLG